MIRHPAPYSDALLEELGVILDKGQSLPKHIHDPFAGPGEKLAEFCDARGIEFSGTDIENWEGDYRVALGDSTTTFSYPNDQPTIVTSPSYGNGVNDHFVPQDNSVRRTYRVFLGHDLHINNSGRYSMRAGKRAEQRYWQIHDKAVQCWAELGLGGFVNVSDFLFRGELYPLVDRWIALLEEHDFVIFDTFEVETPRFRFGENRELRAPYEKWISYGY